jgi:hypothetical protein
MSNELVPAGHAPGHRLGIAAHTLRHEPAEVQLRHLRTPGEISQILHLRDEIDLSVHAASGETFARLEKKETSAASWAVSTWTAKP